MSADLFPETTALVPTEAVDVTPFTMINSAIDKGIDPGELYNLARQWQADIAAEKFAVALATFQAKCPQIKKERSIDLGGGKGPLYASLDDIMAVIKPILGECGLSVTFSAGITDAGHLTAKCMIHHGRHVEASEITLPVPSNMRVNDTQKMGAALSYAKRYALCAALNIVVSDEDRDGAGMHETISIEQVAQLEEWIESTNSNKAKFLEVYGIKSVAEMPVGKFEDAIGKLQRKAKR